MKLPALVVTLALAGTAYAAVEVETRPGRIRVQATRAPLAEILESLARTTGMRVIYDGQPPREPITTELERETPLELLLAVLEVLGPNYAMRLDAGGTRPATLVVVGSPGASGTGRSRTPAAAEPAPSAAAPADAPGTSAPGTVPAAAPDAAPPEPRAEVNDDVDPSTVVRGREVIDPRTGEPYPTFVDPDQPAPREPPRGEHVQGYPTPAQGGAAGTPTELPPAPSGSNPER